MALSQVHIYTPDTPLGMINDDLGQILTDLNALAATYAPLVHTHVEADITDLQSYSLSTHDHDSDYVEVVGDTMTGDLTIADEGAGLQLLVARSGNVNIQMGDTGRAATNDKFRLQYQGGNFAFSEYYSSAWQNQIKVVGQDQGLAFHCPSSALADGSLDASMVHFSVDESGNNLQIKVKYAGGTVKNATVALT